MAPDSGAMSPRRAIAATAASAYATIAARTSAVTHPADASALTIPPPMSDPLVLEFGLDGQELEQVPQRDDAFEFPVPHD